jgi:hypothetical protein
LAINLRLNEIVFTLDILIDTTTKMTYYLHLINYLLRRLYRYDFTTFIIFVIPNSASLSLSSAAEWKEMYGEIGRKQWFRHVHHHYPRLQRQVQRQVQQRLLRLSYWLIYSLIYGTRTLNWYIFTSACLYLYSRWSICYGAHGESHSDEEEHEDDWELHFLIKLRVKDIKYEGLYLISNFDNREKQHIF